MLAADVSPVRWTVPRSANQTMSILALNLFGVRYLAVAAEATETTRLHTGQASRAPALE
jgi:hypothetical protein